MSLYVSLKDYNYPLKSGLEYTNEFTFLIGIILSAQARDEFVNKQTEILFKEFNTPEKILNLGEKLFCYIKNIGLWRNKGINILKMSSEIIEIKKIINYQVWYFNHKGSSEDLICYHDHYISNEGIPTFRAGLLNLSGIGRKSANVFLNTIYQAPVIGVDTHVIRVSNRLGLVNTKNPIKIESILEAIVPFEYKNIITHYLVWHGRKVCFAKFPNCKDCKLKKYCNYFASFV